MKSEARLDSAVFQLTPTRTRCDLVIKANGKTEKIASGLLNPFLAHLKAAQDQIATGGYSITLEPDAGADTLWFTKGTVERFVRFVSTPEVLERVNTIESEIGQIEEAIAIQGNENLHLSAQVEESQSRPAEYVGGSKSMSDADAAKAIVLYKPGAPAPESNGSTAQEENSKVQLLRVLETRKTVLQKEQGMAFARATAAGFNMENIAHLISFAECFGAARLLEACLKFMELWKRKHETGQWLEIEAAEAMSMQSEFSSMNASGIMLSADIGKQKEHREQWPSSNGIESNGKANGVAGGDMNSDPSGDKRIPGDSQAPLGSAEYFHGQFSHPLFPPWPVHSPAGAPVFQPYPMQGMPYYPAGGPYFPPVYPPVEDPRFNSHQRRRSKRHSMDSKGSNAESESYEENARSEEGDGENASDLEKEATQGRKSHRKSGRSGKKKSGMVVIRNLNYITSKKHDNASGSASESETEDSTSETTERNERSHKMSSRPSKSKGNHTNSTETLDFQNEAAVYGQEVDSGNWQVFQSFLLRDDEERGTGADKGMFSGEKGPPVKRRQNKLGADPLLPPERDSGDALDRRMVEFDTVDGMPVRIYKLAASNDDRFHLDGDGSRVSKSDVQLEEIEGGSGGYKKRSGEDFMVYRQDKLMSNKSSSDPLVKNEYEHAGIMDKGSSYNAMDESFIVPVRPGSLEQHGDDNRTAIDMDSEYPSAPQEIDPKIKSQLSYEPDDLSLMPERGMERESMGYDPALDYEVEVQIENDAAVENGKQDATGTKGGPKMASKENKSKSAQDGLGKRKMDALLRKGKLSTSSPLAEAQARANQLRAFKADLQKAKKEKEEEQIRRLEALKRERQKRIAARSSNAAQSPSTPQQKRTQFPANPSPTSHRGSKFSDSEPGSSSPLQRLHMRARSVSSTDSKKIVSSRSDVHKQAAGNGLSRSVSSLPDPKKEGNGVTSELKTASVLRRLSDPKGSNVRSSSLKPVSSDMTPKQNTSDPKGSNKNRTSSLGSVSSSQVPKKRLSDEPQNKKTSTVINLDKTKSATLPDLKIRASRNLSDTIEKMSAVDESAQEGSGSKLVTSEETDAKKTKERTQQFSNGDDSGVVEKIVVMLEHENAPVPVNDMQEHGHEIEMGNGLLGANKGAKTEVVSEYAAIRAPPSPLITCEVDNNSNECQLDQQPKSYEMHADHSKDGTKNINAGVPDKSYQAPYARATSLEDPCTRNIEFNKAPPSVPSGHASTAAETIKVHAPPLADPSGEQIHETVEKPRGKESLKGFRKLLKFGRKSHGATSSEPSLELDSSSMDDQMVVAASSNEVHMLKNLISQDDTYAEGTPPKASRHFSILSPFRGKANEKKLVA